MSSLLHVGSSSRKGLDHETNDDAVFHMDSGVIDSLGALAMICDGVSSVPHGKWAADTSCETIEAFFSQINRKTTPKDFCTEIDALNTTIHTTPRRRGACTLSLCWIQSGQMHSFWLGDTKIAILRERQLHTISQERLDSGQVQAFLGLKGSILDKIETKTTALMHDDIILIMSDGVSEIVSKHDLYHVWKHCYEDPQLCAERLVQFAHFSGSTDDNSVIVMHYKGVQ